MRWGRSDRTYAMRLRRPPRSAALVILQVRLAAARNLCGLVRRQDLAFLAVEYRAVRRARVGRGRRVRGSL